MQKISYLCNKINNVEWSGILFYKVEGHPYNLETFNLNAVDILLMHKGEPTYTEFEINETLIDAYDNNPELENCKMGIIHSHVNMEVFFSGTDSTTLHEYAKLSNFCLSVIVNNRGSIIGKVAYPLITKFGNGNVFYKNNTGELITVTPAQDYEKFEIKEVNLKINAVTNNIEDNFFLKTVEDVIKESEKVVYSPYGYSTANSYKPLKNVFDNNNTTPTKVCKLSVYDFLVNVFFHQHMTYHKYNEKEIINNFLSVKACNKLSSAALESKINSTYNLLQNNLNSVYLFSQEEENVERLVLDVLEFCLELAYDKSKPMLTSNVDYIYKSLSDLYLDSGKNEVDDDLPEYFI
jgi:hypothetical protein